jgi:hypothetical protein
VTDNTDRPNERDKPAERREPKSEPAEEWGERHDHGQTVARGGKDSGHVPGAQENRSS